MSRPTKEFVKVETRLLNDYRFLALSEFDQLFYLKLLLFARITNNKIPNDDAKIELVLRTNRPLNELEMSINRLKEIFPKLKSNKHFHYFLGYNSRMNKYDTKKEDKKALDEDEDIDIDKKKSKQITTDDFIASLKDNSAYKHININTELGKMDAWLSTRKGRQKTRRFVVNWLNKIDKPVESPKKTYEPPKRLAKPDTKERKKVSEIVHETVEKMK